MPSVEACARWAVPKASLTKTSARPPSCAAKAASLAVSAGVEAQVLEQQRPRRAPGPRRRPRLRRPTQSSALATGAAEQLGRAASATGSRRRPSTTWPLGRPRCEASTTRTAAVDAGSSIVGRAARMRVSSATLAAVERDVEVDAHEAPLRRRPGSRSRSVLAIVAPRGRDGRRGATGRASSRSMSAAACSPTRCRTTTRTLTSVAAGHGQRGVDDRRGRVADDVDRDDRVLAELEDALHGALGGGLEGGVDLVGGDLALDHGGQVGAPSRRASARAARSRRACP